MRAIHTSCINQTIAFMSIAAGFVSAIVLLVFQVL